MRDRDVAKWKAISLTILKTGLNGGGGGGIFEPQECFFFPCINFF